MGYLTQLEQLRPQESLCAGTAARRIVLLTGQSSFQSSRISPAQSAFLHAVAPADFEVVDAGWPYHRAMLDRPYRDSSVLGASLRNALQTAWTYTSERYRGMAAETLQQLFCNTTERLVIITGSCGLHLANRAWPEPGGLFVDVAALGPVCFGRLGLRGARVRVLQGRDDIWSKALYRGPVNERCDSGHLNYWTDETARATVKTWIAHAN